MKNTKINPVRKIFSSGVNFENLRKRMVKEQLLARDIRDQKVLDTFCKVPRHQFVSDETKDLSYSDCPLPIGHDQTISQPYMVALMTQCLGLTGNERVLEVGCGSGYQTAILAELAKEVYSVERIPDLAKRAKITLKEIGYQNINIKTGDGSLGWKEFSPYDAIIVTAASGDPSPPLLEQLDMGGRLVAPLGNSMSQMLTRFSRSKEGMERQEFCACVFVPLIGKYGLICK